MAFLRQAAAIGLASAVAGFSSQGMWNVFRVLVHQDGGAVANGFLQASRTIAVAYFGVVLQGLSAVIFPLFAAARGTEELSATVHRALRLVVGFGPAVVLGALATRRLMVTLLFSGAFESSSELTGLLMAADLAKAVVWALGGPLLYTGRASAYVRAELFGTAALMACSLALYPWIGMNAIGVGHVLGYCVSLFLYAAVLRSATGVVTSRRALFAVLAMTAALTACAVAPPNLFVEGTMLVVAGGWFAIAFLRFRAGHL
jgi:O-antigen/teichoic acid export membrane protein